MQDEMIIEQLTSHMQFYFNDYIFIIGKQKMNLQSTRYSRTLWKMFSELGRITFQIVSEAKTIAQHENKQKNCLFTSLGIRTCLIH